jgi:hypothetical protein
LLCSSPGLPFSVLVSLDFSIQMLVYNSCFLPQMLPNHYQGLHHTSFDICTKFVACSLSHPLRNCIRPHTQLKIKGHKNQHGHLAENFYTDSKDMLVLSCHGIMVLQLGYRWQHQSKKL